MENGGFRKSVSEINLCRHDPANLTASNRSPPLIQVTQPSRADLFASPRKNSTSTGDCRIDAPLTRDSRSCSSNHISAPIGRPRAKSFSGPADLNKRQKMFRKTNKYCKQLSVPQPRKSRSGSVVSLNLLNRPRYIPVERPNERNNSIPNGVRKPANGSIPTQDAPIDSFADFIEVRRKSANIRNSSKMRRRLVYKNGDCNVTHKHIRKIRRHYLADVFTTLIDLKWRWALVIFIATFLLTWVFFAFIWWLIGFTNGDFDPDLSKRRETPCMDQVKDFPTAFLFSVETQHTIGYGGRAITGECPEAIVILLIQSVTGVLVQALMTGMIFAKLSRPKKRAETLMFSKKAVICQRDGELCLMFRIGDMRSSHLIEAHIRGMVIRRRVTKEGEVLPLDHQDLDFGLDTGSDRLLIIWPVIVIHKINKISPFWRMSKADLLKENFELIIVLEGVIESTGMTTQARTSYLPGEIQWGHRLERLVTFQKEGGEYQVDYTRFENTVAVDTPIVSAKELAAQNPQSNSDDSNSSESETDFTLYRTGSAQTSDSEEDVLLFPEGSASIPMSTLGAHS